MKSEKQYLNRIALCEIIRKSTCLVKISIGEENFGTGTGVAISADGSILTAAHVVTGRIPQNPDDGFDPSVTILVKPNLDSVFIEYKPIICGVFINLPLYFRRPMVIDLALLQPMNPLENVPSLPVSKQPSPVGADILMAGYSDDMELPLEFDRVLDHRNNEVRDQQQNLDILRNQLMIKSGMVGSKNEIHLTDSESGHEHSGALYYLDNGLHSGSSGGPVVNNYSEIIGIITQRAITSVAYEDTSNLRVPSGSTVAISPSLVLHRV